MQQQQWKEKELLWERINAGLTQINKLKKQLETLTIKK